MTYQWRCPSCGECCEVEHDQIVAYCEECGRMFTEQETDE